MDTIGSAMDSETTVAARRDVLLRALVREGLVEMCRLLEMGPGGPRTVAVATARPRTSRSCGSSTRLAASTSASSSRAWPS